MATNMDRLPTEVIFEVCQNLDFFDDIAAFRLQGRRYADVGAESLVSRVRVSHHSLLPKGLVRHGLTEVSKFGQPQ